MNMKLFLRISLLFIPFLAHAECTIGVASGTATRDGRPVVFKTRDTSSWSLEFKVQMPAGYHAYAGNTSVDSSTVWMGVNEAGFGITQSAAYNVGGSGSGLGNGTMMNYALERCDSIGDFEDILIATNSSGRSTKANYAVFDAYGGAAIFECAPHEYDRYDADSIGLVVRANFSYLGDSGRCGQNRMERAYQLMSDAIAGDSLDARFVVKHVITDLDYPGQNPYPLPWTGSFDGMPAGWIDTGPFTDIQTICNANTHAAGVARGVPPGGDTEDALLWCIFASPVASVPFPLFPAAHNEPPEGVGSSSEMFTACRAKYDSLFSHSSVSYWLDASYLLNESGEGVLSYAPSIIDWAFDTVDYWLTTTTSPLPSERSDFQDVVMDRVLAAYLNGVPLGIEEAETPERAALAIAPNPFNSSCKISIPETSERIEGITIHDISGREIDRLDVDWPTFTEIVWTPKDDLPAGIYLIRTRPSTKPLYAKAILVK